MIQSKFRKICQLIVAGLIVCLMTTVAWSKGPANVANTIHNLSTSSPYILYQSDNEDEVCIFCHTPHGGTLEGPLWNHDLPGVGSFTHYNNVTLSSYLQGLGTSRDIGFESLVCMACHDGSIAVDHVINESNDTGNITFSGFTTDNLYIIDLFGQPGPRIGGSPSDSTGTGHLEDDHPISFSYDSVLSSPDGKYGVGGSHEDELRQPGTVAAVDTTTARHYKGEGVRFFGDTNRVECASCHDPHVDYVTNTEYTPFLIRPNTGSDLCLSCHVK